MKILVFLMTLGIIGLCFFLLSKSQWIFSLNHARRKGLIPKKDKATMFDVRRLLQHGERDAAIRVYCEIFECSKSESHKAIKDLEQSIQK